MTKPVSGKNWESVSKKIPKNTDEIIKILLKNRGINTEAERQNFINPIHPSRYNLKQLGISQKEVDKAIGRINKSKKRKIIVYGDYDADGICATAIFWETLYRLGFDILPYIPERFSEGYGLNADSIKKIKDQYPSLDLIVSVDNGIVAHEAVIKAKDMGVDVIITDHHKKGEDYPKASAIIHTEKICGAAISWIFAREIVKKFKTSLKDNTGLELAGLATIADQVPLIGVNRSFAKYGIESLQSTNRKGLLKMIEKSGVSQSEITGFTVGYILAPRINAAGRLEHAIDSLRLLCTNNLQKAEELSSHLERINARRQNIVDEAVGKALGKTSKKDKIIVIDGEYNEGVIGLIASKLTEEYHKPSIVLSRKDDVMKASARSIPGVDIIKEIRKFKKMLLTGGGHPMAAGFSIKVSDYDKFKKGIVSNLNKTVIDKMLEKKLKIDMDLKFENITWDLVRRLKKFEPLGMNNPTPIFATRKVKVKEIKKVGRNGNHIKLLFEKNGIYFQAIGFNLSRLSEGLQEESEVDIAYAVEENIWNNSKSMQLKIKDIIQKNCLY